MRRGIEQSGARVAPSRDVLAASGALALAAASLAANPPPGSEVRFADGFDGEALDTTAWFHRVHSVPVQGGLNLASNVRVGGGVMTVDYRREFIDGAWWYTGGGIISRLPYGYGYYEVRSRAWGGGRGLHTSFWTRGIARGWFAPYDALVNAGLAPADNSILEIDVYETDSAPTLNDKAASNFYYWSGPGGSLGSVAHPIDTTTWHVYGLDWGPSGLRWYQDGRLVRTEPDPGIHAPQNVWLTALATPDWYLPPRPAIEDGQFPGKSEWDYFRFLARRHPGANLLGNAGFEIVNVDADAVDPVQVPKGWIETGDATAARVARAAARTGSRGLAIDGGSAFSVAVGQAIEGIANGRVRVSAWVRSSGGQRLAVLRASGHGGTGVEVPVPATAGWVRVDLGLFTVTTGRVRLEVVVEASAPGTWLHVDDVRFGHADPGDGGFVLDEGSPAYAESGSWLASSLTGWAGSGTRYASSGSATATWTLPELGGEHVDLYLHNVVHSNSDPATRVELRRGAATEAFLVDQTTSAPGWLFLGRRFLPAGREARLVAMGTTPGKVLRADAVWVHPSPGADPWGEWVTSALADVAEVAPGDDPDRDGVPNLLEFVLGRDATRAEPGPWLGLFASTSGLSLVTELRDGRGALDWRWLGSDDLHAWAPLDLGAPAITTGSRPGFSRHAWTLPIAGAAPRFVRGELVSR